MRLWIVMALLLVTSARAQVSDVCVSCGEPIKGDILMFASPYYKDRQPVCSACAALQRYCATCRMPTKKGLDLKDGRVLCDRDATTAVLSGEQAKMIFEEVKRDMILTFRGSKVLPDRNITFGLADKTDLEALSRFKRFPSTHNSLLGLTRSRAKGKDFEHDINVLAGMPRNKFMAVCAHEYGHAWMEENVTPGRPLDSDTVEGFCELLGYKYMTEKADAVEKKLIMDNDYTHGQIALFVRAEKEYNFYHVMKWIISGEDVSLSSSNMTRLLAMRSGASALPEFGWPPPSAVRTMAPTNLVLKNISGTAKRRFAMINGATLTANETAKVPFASSNLTVRCVEIRDLSVVVQVAGESEPRELFLPVPGSVELTKGNAPAR